MTKPDGGPAFPRPLSNGSVVIANEERNLEVAPQCGMTLRDYFAGQALMGFLANPITECEDKAGKNLTHAEILIAVCFHLADLMLAEREKT